MPDVQSTDRPLAANEYRCAVCEAVFEKGWSDEEAAGELDGNFPGFTPDDCELVCDGCYQRVMHWVGGP